MNNEFYREAWIRLTLEQSGVDYSSHNTPLTVKSLEELKRENWSVMFDKVLISFDQKLIDMQHNRLCLGSLRYGKFGDKEKAARQDRERYIENKVEILRKTKNIECLLDIANILLLESVESKLNLTFDYNFNKKSPNFPFSSQFLSQIVSYFSENRSDKKIINDRLQYYLTKCTIDDKTNKVINKYFVDCQYGMLLHPYTIIELYQEFKYSGNLLYLSFGIGLCHTLYTLYETLTDYSFSAIDDGYHIPSY